MASILSKQEISIVGDGIGEFVVYSDNGAILNVNSSNGKYRAGLCDTEFGPFTDSILITPPGSASVFVFGGGPGSSGTISHTDLTDLSVGSSTFICSSPEEKKRDVHSWEIFDYVSSFFDLFEDRELLLRYWNAIQMMESDISSIVSDADHDDHVLEMGAFHTRRNIVFEIDPRDITVSDGEFKFIFDSGLNVFSVPKMYSKIITDSYDEYTEGIDYTCLSGVISFKRLKVRDGEKLTLFCPVVYVDEYAPRNNFGYLLGMVDASSESYLAAIRALWYAYWNGPSQKNIENAISVACGIPASQSSCVVVSVTTTQDD